jgi:hypothetical protein
MVTLLTLIILFLVPNCEPQPGNGSAWPGEAGLNQGFGRTHGQAPSELLLFQFLTSGGLGFSAGMN